MQQSFHCPKCGAQIPIGQSFCGTCGQRFEYRCRHCGTAIGDSSGFCANCGAKVHHTVQPARPAASRVEYTSYPKATRARHTLHRPASHIGRYLALVAIIFVMVGIIFAIGTSTQGGSSSWLGGYVFGGQSPPSSPPASDGTVGQHKSITSNVPTYTEDQVIAAARELSPNCRLQTIRRTG